MYDRLLQVYTTSIEILVIEVLSCFPGDFGSAVRLSQGRPALV